MPVAIFGMLGAIGQNMWQSKEAQKNRDWQERMSNTALQRYRADAEKAGLNPILGLNKGGASTPGGATANIQGLAQAAGDIVGSVKQMKVFKEKLAQEVATTDQMTAQADKTVAETDVLKAREQRELLGQQLDRQQAALNALGIQKGGLELPELMNRAEFEQMFSSVEGSKGIDAMLTGSKLGKELVGLAGNAKTAKLMLRMAYRMFSNRNQ